MKLALPSRLWAQRVALLGLASWIASVLLAWSTWSSAESLVIALQVLGGLLLLVGFLGWRRGMTQAEYALALPRQLIVFARPLVGRVVLIASVLLAVAALADDRVSLAALAMAAIFFIVGIALVVMPSQHRL